MFREQRADDPILPMDLMMRPMILASVIGSFLIGGILFGIETYVPLFMQGVRGGNATEAGQALTPLFLAWAVSVTVAAKAVVRWGFRRGGMVGAGLISVGMLGLVFGAMFPEWARPAFTVPLVVVGMGMGPASLSFILAVQHAVTWNQRGVATGAVIFFRTIGGAIGVGILGGALGWELGHYLLASAPRASTSARPSVPRLIRCSSPISSPWSSRAWGSHCVTCISRCWSCARHAGLYGLAAGQVVRERGRPGAVDFHPRRDQGRRGGLRSVIGSRAE